MTDITIGFKAVAELASPGLCPRCFWAKNNLRFPFQSFPGVFNTLDKFCKEYVDSMCAAKTDPWFRGADSVESLKCPHWSKFKVTRPYGLTARGQADHIIRVGGRLVIWDSKVAKRTAKADERAALYELQLNLYRLAAKETGIGTADELRLVYFSPEAVAANPTDGDSRSAGVRFDVTPLDVRIMPDAEVEAYLQRAYEILSGPIPAADAGCKDCATLDALGSRLQVSTSARDIVPAETKAEVA